MPSLKIAATERTPEIDFDFDSHHLRLKGESYPEDAAAFYGPVFAVLDEYLAGLGDGACRFDFELIYFNSSSAKAIMLLLEKLQAAAASGATVIVSWYYDEEDDTMKELGEEFGEDVEHAEFHLEKLAAKP
jgi:SiaC family regulatory phosphoprotein